MTQKKRNTEGVIVGAVQWVDYPGTIGERSGGIRFFGEDAEIRVLVLQKVQYEFFRQDIGFGDQIALTFMLHLYFRAEIVEENPTGFFGCCDGYFQGIFAAFGWGQVSHSRIFKRLAEAVPSFL
ncbi:MAG: hypothetical protein JXB43_06825 [Dehalococcoidia bacterium]|nr:hypothetical protein [Dehalococcoidia bacterium]